jgi:hypothetical protein
MRSSSTNSSLRLLIVAACVVAGGLVFWLALHPHGPVRVSPPVAQTAPPTQESADPLQATCDALLKEANSGLSRQTLAELRRQLSAMPTAEAVAAIRKFLDSKADASTHLEFKLASNGTLEDAPTLRTFLLDEMARLDPAAAAEYAKTILASMDSPDEWAVALRNLATGDTSAASRDFLEEKTAELLQYTPWQQNPSVGYLEAFDVAVFLGGTDLVPTLTDLVRMQDNQAVAHASFLALDRLVINNPDAVLASLEAEPDLMEGRESTRADFFARADVRDPQQEQTLESYLLNPAITSTELHTFAGIYPNNNFMISDNLLTQNQTLSHDDLLSRDAQSLLVAQQWLTDPRFSGLTPVVQSVIQRLEGFAAQARQGQ